MKMSHFIDLTDIGGVESLFANYLLTPERQCQKHDVITTRTVHPHTLNKIEPHIQSLSSIRYWHKIKIPLLSLRRHYYRHLLNKHANHLTLIWNQLGNPILWNQPITTPTVYYEHGIAWRTQPRQEITDFLNSMTAVICCSEAACQIIKQRFHKRL